jgi:hypothetical protein
VGITSLRRILFRKGYFVDINDDNLVNIVSNRHSQNALLEAPSTEEVFPLKQNPN